MLHWVRVGWHTSGAWMWGVGVPAVCCWLWLVVLRLLGVFSVEKNHIAKFYIGYIGGTMYIMDVRGLMGWGDADMRGGPDGGVLFCMVGGGDGSRW